MRQLTRHPPGAPTPVLRSPPRMPAILDGEEAVSKWLDFGEVSAQEALKLIHPTENIAFHPVSSMVNRSWNNAPECLLPLHLLTGKVGAWMPAGPAGRSVCSEGPVSACWDLYNQRLNPNHPQFFLVRSKAAQGRDSQSWLRVGRCTPVSVEAGLGLCTSGSCSGGSDKRPPLSTHLGGDCGKDRGPLTRTVSAANRKGGVFLSVFAAFPTTRWGISVLTLLQETGEHSC